MILHFKRCIHSLARITSYNVCYTKLLRLFLKESHTDIVHLTNQDIGRFVERDQDNGLKSGAIKTKLSALYAFIGFLVDKEILPYKLLHKKLRIKLEDPLPKAIPVQDIESLLRVIKTTRNRALILLLLRTGMRIGELLNITLPDIHISERKILIYQGEKNYQGRVVYYSKDAEKALRKWLKVRNPAEPFLFYGRNQASLTYVAAWTTMRNALEIAGLSGKGYSRITSYNVCYTKLLRRKSLQGSCIQ